MRSRNYLLRNCVSLALLSAVVVSQIGASSITRTSVFALVAVDSSQAAAILAKGRSLIRQSNAEQALGLLEEALRQFNVIGDAKGAAAAHDALGDLYSRQGQFEVALQHYKDANQGFKSSQDEYDAN